ncbi:MAG: tetratricopeptide repeat protein [Myxococcales bacterium]|nr:tetratricopeptide repeat protein [Myxococcales bacterium]
MSEKRKGAVLEREWVLVALDAKMSRRQGMPTKVPVPKDEFEGLADKGLQGEVLRAWIREFLAESEMGKDGNWRRRNSEMVTQLEGFYDKAPLWEKAQKLFAANDFENALKTLKRIVVMCPDDHAARMNYASALANSGDYDKAYKELKQIRESFAGEPDYHVTFAQILVMREEKEAATEELYLALDAKPDHMGAMDALAKLGVLAKIYTEPRDATSLTFVPTAILTSYFEEQVWGAAERTAAYYLEQLGYHASEKRFELALLAADRARGIEPSEKAEAGRVSALRELGRTDDAIAAAREFVLSHQGAVLVHNELALTLHRAGRADEARLAIENALAADPGDQTALALRFWPADRGDLQEVQAAIPGLASWAEAHTDVAGAWRSLARATLSVGREEDALAVFAKAVALAPQDDELRSEWWSELSRAGHYDAVVRDSETLSDMKTRDWQLRWNEAEAYRGLNRMMEARACYMQLNGDESLQIDIRKRAKRAATELGMGGSTPAS